MKKILLLLILGLLFCSVSCTTDASAQHDRNHVKQTIIDLPEGYELVSADFNSEDSYVTCFIRRADTSYIVQEKQLLVYSSSGNIRRKFIFDESYDFSSDRRVAEKYLAGMGAVGDGDTIIYNESGFVVKRKQ